MSIKNNVPSWTDPLQTRADGVFRGRCALARPEFEDGVDVESRRVVV